MTRRLEGAGFWLMLALSAAAHAVAPFMGGTDASSQEPDFTLEESEVRPPMTLRILAEPKVAVQTPQPERVDPIFTADGGARSVLALEPDATRLERERPDPRTAPDRLIEAPPPEPELEPLDVPLEVPVPEPDAPPPPEPDPEPTKAPITEDVELASPMQQDASSSVRARASTAGHVNIDPPYPARAMRRRMEGTVFLNVTIGTDGRAKRVELAESSGHRILDNQALKYVKRWKFTPAKDGSGQPVEDTLRLPITFDLRD